MNAVMLLHHAVGVVEHRERIYGSPEALFASVVEPYPTWRLHGRREVA